MNLQPSRPLIILLAGPTAVGKTALSLELAARLGSEIVNADSMQVYRCMDIGTAKPGPQERARIRHHLLDVADPDEAFDAARYLELAAPVLDALHRKRSIPLIVGGTGLYMKILTRGICPGAPSDSSVREQILKELAQNGVAASHQELHGVDPELAVRIHPNDRQRIIRALEVYRLTGMPLSHWQAQHRFEQTLYRSIKIFLYRERKVLYERIDRRVHDMLQQGFVDEVKKLLEMGYGPELKPMQSLGYRQVLQYLSGDCSMEGAIEQIQRETRRYAKRQITWFRGDPEFHWFYADDAEDMLEWVERQVAAAA